MESTTFQRTNAQPPVNASDDATIQVLDAAMQRAWATSEPLLMLVRTNRSELQRWVLDQLQGKAAESGAWSMHAEANVVGLDGPYGPLLRAMTAFAPRIAAEPGSLGVSLRHRLTQAAAPTGKLLAQFCPAFAPLTTSTHEPEPLSFGFAKDRLETLLARVFAALSPSDPPTVFFLRHASRADAATLRSLARILGHAEARQFVLVALVDVRDEPRHENAWKTFISGKKYVVERFDVGTTKADNVDTEPHSGTFETGLGAETRRVIEAISCSGQVADLDAITTALQSSAQEITDQLMAAIETGTIRRQGPAYAFVDHARARVCQNATDVQTRGQMHLRLGRFFTFERPRSDVPHLRFVGAAHLVAAARDDALQSCNDAERVQAAQALLDAARRAMEMAAHDVADEYLHAAMGVLQPLSEARADLASGIDFARLECACALGDRPRAQSLFATLRERAPNAPEMAAAWRWVVELATRSGQHVEAIELAAQALAPHQIRLEASPSTEVIDHAFYGLWEALGDRAIEEIIDLERMTKPEALEATDLLFMVHPSAQALGAGPADLVGCHLSRLALLHGNADASSVGHAALGAAVIGRQKDHRTGTRFGKVALQLCQQRGTSRHHATVAMKFAAAMSIWTHPLQNSIDQCVRTYEVANACGDARASSRISAMIAFLTVLQGTSLDEVADEALRRRRAIRSQACDDEGMGELCDAIERFVGHQKGRTAQRRSKSSSWTDDSRLGHVACRVLDLISLVLTHEYEAALFVSMNLSKSIAAIGSQILVPEYWFWTMLASTSMRTSGLPEGFENVLADFERWADRCPQTFQHKHALLLGERARLEGRDMDAMRAYDQAITEARENGYNHIEAFAAEITTRFYATRDFPLIAATYFRTARNSYGRWGASSKVLQIDRRFPKLSGNGEQASPSSPPPPSIRGSTDMDVFTAVKVAQTVSKEIVLQRLLVTLMKISIEHAAAERCHVLLEQEDGELNHAGKALATSKGLEIEVPGPTVKSFDEILPASIIEHVRATRESVCLDEAAADRTWADDPYIAANRPRSIVCFPILRQSTIVGMFYLENNAARSMFTPRRLALLEFLANQAAISLEHAKLYADLARENSERRRAEQVLRKSEERLRRLVEIADVIPWEVDADNGNFTFIGSQAEKRLGWAASLWNKPNFLRENVHPDDRERALAAFVRACAEGKHPGIDFRLLAQDGQSAWLHMVIGSVEQENGQRLLSGFFFDITERKEAEQTLRDKIDIIERQKDDIRALSTPLLDVSEGVVAMPILGDLDEDRAGRIMDVLLDTITKRNIRSAILDLTGVSSISNATAESLGRIVRAVELVGARAIVAGIRADVARAIISLDVGLGRIETRASMKDALRVLVQTAPALRNAPKNHVRSSR